MIDEDSHALIENTVGRISGCLCALRRRHSQALIQEKEKESRAAAGIGGSLQLAKWLLLVFKNDPDEGACVFCIDFLQAIEATKC